MEQHHQKNLKVIFAMEEEEFARWVVTLSNDGIDYVSWLVEEAEETLDEMMLAQSELIESRMLIEHVTRHNS